MILNSASGISGEDHVIVMVINAYQIPILPSNINVNCASRFVAELLLVAQIDRRNRQLAVVANRTRQNTRSCQMLMRFLTSLRIPIIAVLRDSQNYVHAAGQGIGICEDAGLQSSKRHPTVEINY